MEHDSEPPSEEPTDVPPHGATRFVSIVLKIIGGGVVLFIVAVALVFGVCLFG